MVYLGMILAQFIYIWKRLFLHTCLRYIFLPWVPFLLETVILHRLWLLWTSQHHCGDVRDTLYWLLITHSPA